jgi:tryptophan-rich sensory protein
MKMKKKPFQILKFLLCLLLCVGGGWLTGLFTNPGLHGWYQHLVKSSLTPPSWVFPLTWTLLYFLMAISLYLVWVAPKKNKKIPVSIFAVQLFLNFIWSFIFFTQENPGVALIDVILLWIAIIATMILFFRISKIATYLLIPYLAWVSFAIYLTYFIWVNN